MAWPFGFSRRRSRSAFWLLGSRRLVVAVLEPTTDEPLLLTCATLVLDEAPSGADFAPGLLETAAAANALRLPHVAALDREWCRVEPRGQGPSGEDIDAVHVEVDGSPDLRAIVARPAVVRTAGRFRSAGLRLVSLDCADCALLSLARYLGRAAEAGEARAAEETSALDPLTAVSVSPECEVSAARAAELLVVPVGLALARFGLLDHA
jgi:hypothetical protein